MSLKHADLSELTVQITRIAEGSAIAPRMREVVVEANDDPDGGEFLRVILKMTKTEGLELEEVEPLVRTIEEAVAVKDERFPSVRFVDAT
jgi:hypothetical protein